MGSKVQIIKEFLLAHKGVVVAILIIGFLNSFFMVLVSVSMGKYYEIVFQHHSNRGRILEFFHLNVHRRIEDFLFLFVTLLSIRALLIFSEKYLAGLMGEKFSQKIREELFKHQLSLPMLEHSKKATGKYLLRYSGDLASIQRFLTKGILLFACDCLFLLTVLFVLIILDFQIVLFLSAFTVVFFLISIPLNGILRKVSQEKRDVISSNLSFVNSRLSSLISIKVFNKEPVELRKFEKRSEKLFLLGKRYQLFSSLVYAIPPFLLYLIVSFLLYHIYTLHELGHTSPGMLITFVILFITIFPVLKRVMKVNLIWQIGLISFDKLLAIFQIPSETLGGEESGNLKGGPISFQHVSFCYQQDKWVLWDFSCEIEANTIVRFSGKGKSTLFKLLLGIYRPSEGKIFIGDQDLGQLSPRSIRKEIALVSEEVPLVGNTIFEAISYSRKEEKRNAALDVLKRIRFRLSDHEPIDLDYKIGENGRNLSGSQIKLLMIARALLTNKRILLLDDPFGGLDERARSYVRAYIHVLASTHTILIIDHLSDGRLEIDRHIQVDQPQLLNQLDL
jgi:ABC-type bacteriocin/lantibiotic exporter with double-glycine peptidase domain